MRMPFAGRALLAVKTAMACAAMGLVACASRGDPGVGSASDQLRTTADCPTGYAILEGTDGDDTLVGTSGSDCILGYDGDDLIRGRGGDDYLVGGQGEDVIFGNSGNDLIFGERGDDVLFGGFGDDLIRGGGGDDQIFGSWGEDRLRGGNGDDVIRGGPGDDDIDGGDDDDELLGGSGDDVITGGPGDDVITGGSGEDTIVDEVADVEVTLELNNLPVVALISASPTRIDAGETTVLTTTVTDTDDDMLTYVWSASCDGTFDDATSSQTNFTLTSVDGSSCTLSVEVADGRGGDANGSITIETAPALVPSN